MTIAKTIAALTIGTAALVIGAPDASAFEATATASVDCSGSGTLTVVNATPQAFIDAHPNEGTWVQEYAGAFGRGTADVGESVSFPIVAASGETVTYSVKWTDSAMTHSKSVTVSGPSAEECNPVVTTPPTTAPEVTVPPTSAPATTTPATVPTTAPVVTTTPATVAPTTVPESYSFPTITEAPAPAARIEIGTAVTQVRPAAEGTLPHTGSGMAYALGGFVALVVGAVALASSKR